MAKKWEIYKNNKYVLTMTSEPAAAMFLRLRRREDPGTAWTAKEIITSNEEGK